MDLGIDKISLFLSYSFQPNPTTSLKIVHVGGTNGKGSVCALVAAALQAAGYKVGVFNSPHLIDPKDAIRINQRQISISDHLRLRDLIAQKQALFTELATDTKRFNSLYPDFSLNAEAHNAAGFKLSNFEISVVEALLWFQENFVDIAVLEVGVGGAKDATNIFDLDSSFIEHKFLTDKEAENSHLHFLTKNSLVQVICPIGLDHLGLIGNNINEIVTEKMGISRSSSILVVAKQTDNQALKKICEITKSYNLSTVIYADISQNVACDSPSIQNSLGSIFKIPKTPEYYIKDGEITLVDNTLEPSHVEVQISLFGEFQSDNAATAYYTVEALRKYYKMGRITDDAIRKGFKSSIWPGRMTWASVNMNSILENKPQLCVLPSLPTQFGLKDERFSILVDGAHNPLAAKELVKYVKLVADQYSIGMEPRKELKLRWISAFTSGKDMSEIFSILLDNNYSNSVWAVEFTLPKEMPWIRSTESQQIIRNVAELGFKNVSDTKQFKGIRQVFAELSCMQNEQKSLNNQVEYLNIFCGSLYMISDLFQYFNIKFWEDS
ncbi:hypothetical protein BB561_001096 [Smittium simulii]|uniref:Mur ligase central domain-containing protein n=1 Tax=Smittium simulii TaxID=133385 RepID=A0A2T9YW55_9FUNG|nr:hypothetical protein BB561_001096 [Smittium simulii]